MFLRRDAGYHALEIISLAPLELPNSIWVTYNDREGSTEVVQETPFSGQFLRVPQLG